MKEIVREDYELGWLLKYESVAWFDESRGEVQILNRKIYPEKKEFVICKTYEEVAQAIKNMITQSGGPFSAASMGMALAAYQFQNQPSTEFYKKMEQASYDLSHARPTTSIDMQKCTNESFQIFSKLLEEKTTAKEIILKLKQNAIEQNNRRYKKNTQAGALFSSLVPNNSSILTQCFGETTVGGFLRQFKKDKKNIKVFCAETRPFFQGARLTASLAADMGFETTIITDNMPAALMADKKLDFCVSATDVVTMDGSIINKIGTLQIAICAKHFGIPYYAIGFPDKKYPTADLVKIEYRNSNEILKNIPHIDGVKSIYPAFDITPSNLCSGIITDKKILFKKD